MSILHIRSVPDDLYLRVQELARLKNRSLSAQVVTMLYQALTLEDQQRQQGEVLSAIRRRRFSPPENAPSSVDLLREARR